MIATDTQRIHAALPGARPAATCTISPDENERQIDSFLTRHDDFRVERPPSDLPVWDHPSVPALQQSLPHRDGTDGFFISRLRRT